MDPHQAPTDQSEARAAGSRADVLTARVSRAWETVKSAWMLVPGLLVLFAVSVYVFQHYRSPSIILTPIVLPPQLAQSGLSARELTERLLDRIDSLREAARPSVSQSGWIIETDIQYPNIEIPGVKMSLPAFLDFLDGNFGHKARKVTWEVSARPKGGGPDSWIVTASVTGGHLHQSVFSPANPDSAIAVIATKVLEDAEPYIAIQMFRYSGSCDTARLLAARQLIRARRQPEQTEANNVMGFVSECGFNPTGANIDDAELFYRRAIQIDPTDPRPHANLARILAEHGDSAASNREFSLATRLGPTIASTYEAWGYALMLAGDFKGAADRLRTAISLDPSVATAYLNLGWARLNLADTGAAIEALGVGVFRQPDAAALKEYGKLLRSRRKWAGAADAFRRTLQLSPGDQEALYWLAIALDSVGKRDAAKGAFAALARQSTDSDLYCAAARREVKGVVCGR